MPVVRVMGDLVGLSDMDHVGPDHLAVGALAYQYLAGQGCRNLAFVTRYPARDVIRARALGFATAALGAGIAPANYVVSTNALEARAFGSPVVSCSSIEEIAKRLASASPRPDGVFVSRDAEIVRLQPALQQLGVRVGEEMLLISCDNDDVRLSMIDPRPPSIDLSAEEIGRRALMRLCNRIRKPEETPVRIHVAPMLARVNGQPSRFEVALS
jgi:DNA-binding LacI/PurR family transcriptional regulator